MLAVLLVYSSMTAKIVEVKVLVREYLIVCPREDTEHFSRAASWLAKVMQVRAWEGSSLWSLSAINDDREGIPEASRAVQAFS